MKSPVIALGFILLASVLTGACASTSAYTGSATSIQVRERLNPQFSGLKYSMSEHLTKMVLVDNPYDKNVSAKVDCGWDSQWDLVIAAKSTQRILVTPQRAKAYDKSCYVTDWSFTTAKPSYL